MPTATSPSPTVPTPSSAAPGVTLRRAPHRGGAKLRVGQRLRLSCTDGEYVGRVVDGPDGFIRLRAGAGFWVVEARRVLGITVLAEPSAVPVNEPETSGRAAERAARILARWP
jgi:hypothetical protein